MILRQRSLRLEWKAPLWSAALQERALRPKVSWLPSARDSLAAWYCLMSWAATKQPRWLARLATMSEPFARAWGGSWNVLARAGFSAPQASWARWNWPAPRCRDGQRASEG